MWVGIFFFLCVVTPREAICQAAIGLLQATILGRYCLYFDMVILIYFDRLVLSIF